MTSSDRHLVFDVGGTQLRAAVYDGGGGSLFASSRVDAPSFLRHAGAPWTELRTRLLESLSELRARLDPASAVSSAVIAFPGPVDDEHRVVAAPTLWGSLGAYPYALERDLRDRWPGVSTRVINDVTAAGYRYLRSTNDDFCIVTVSSGVGNKVFVDGRPLLGRSGLGGEIGHLQVDPAPGAAECDCGGRGHVGAIASGRGMLALARRRAVERPDAFRSSSLAIGASTLTPEALAEAYRLGDAFAVSVVREGADALAQALSAVHLAIGVDRIVLIGGFALGLGRRFCDDLGAAVGAR